MSNFLCGHQKFKSVAKIRNSGFSLIELMIAIAIGSFMVLGLTTLTSSTQASYSAQTQLSQMSDKQRFATLILTNTVQSAGYFTVTPSSIPTASTALPAWNSGAAYTYAAGQSVAGSPGGAPTVPDSFAIRFEADANDISSPLNCQGAGNSGTSNLVVENVFTISGNVLSCAVGQTTAKATTGAAPGAAVPLIDGVQNMKIWFGVDATAAAATPAPTTPQSVTQYIPVSAMTAAQYQCVMSVMIVLTLTNPLANSTGAATTSMTTVIRTM